MQPDRLRLGDEITDSEDDAIANENTVARPFGSEGLGCERIPAE
jgi:hypothetical protein